MAKMIRLPSGLNIDLEQGEIRTNLGPGPIPINRNPGSTYTHRLNLWDRFDYFIGSIGNWFADHSERITSVMSVIIFASGAIPFIIWLFSLGLFWGIVAGIFLGGIVYYALMVIIGIFIWISNIALGIIRYIFYSGKTFLITLAIIGGLIGLNYWPSSQSKPVETTEQFSPATTTYRCTASSLNIRSGPSTSYAVIGSIKRNELVKVYEITNGFAKIKLGDRYGYASVKYLSIDETN